MHQLLYRHFQTLAAKYELRGPFLEIGASPGGHAILAGDYFREKSDRVAINLNEQKQEEGIDFIKCNSNDMKGIFKDGQFQTVLSNAVLEHDRQFWLSVAEMKRVLAPGGMLVVGAPAFLPMSQTRLKVSLPPGAKATLTYDVHANPDYWRFSRRAFTDVICEGLKILDTRVVGAVPRLVAVAQKP